MHPKTYLSPHQIGITEAGIEITGPEGPVRLRWIEGEIQARYIGEKLVNGSAQAYAEALSEAALHTAATFPLPWNYDSEGRQRINDHRQFYEQTFQRDLCGIERLLYWMRREL